MQKIKLNKDLFQIVRSGLKTATTRKGLKEHRIGPAYFYNPESPDEKIPIFITRVHFETWHSVKEDSWLYFYENYETESCLIEALELIYGDMENEQEMTVLFFTTR